MVDYFCIFFEYFSNQKNGMIIEKTVDGGFSQRSVDNFLDSYRVYLTKRENTSFLLGNLRLDATQIIAMNVDLV